MQMRFFNTSAKYAATRTKRALVFGISDALYFALGTMLVGFFKHNPSFDDTIVVFHENLLDAQQDTLKSIYPDIVFHQFTREYVASQLAEANHDLLDRYSHLYFAKFELPNLLDTYEQVLWMDVDLLVRGPLDRLWDFAQFCWRPTTRYTFDRQQDMYESFADQIANKDLRSPNGGLIGLGRAARNTAAVSTAQLYNWFNQFQSRVVGTQGDEFAFFMLAAQSNTQVTLLPISYNCPSGTKGAAHAQVIHAVGDNKFWNSRALHLAYPDWWLWHRTWVANGGAASTAVLSGSEDIINTPNEIVRCAEFQDLWTETYEEIWSALPSDIMPSLRVDRRSWELYLRGWPKRFLHIKALKEDNGDLFVGIHLERGAARHPKLLRDVTERLARSQRLTKAPTTLGFAWIQPTDETQLSDDLLSCARLISGLPYRKA